MKFDPECVKDILLVAEEEVTDNLPCVIKENSINQRLKKYSFSEIAYHIQQCQEYNLIKYSKNILGNYKIIKILPDGNELIAKSEKTEIWKSALIKGMHSIPAMLSTLQSLYELADTFN